MKNLKLALIASLLFVTAIAQAAPTATYYRVWQGFKKADVSTASFQGELPTFMNWTVSLYGDVLNEYVVVVPPADKPSTIPDEFALLALSDEASYRDIRATTEGKAYGDAHWQLFEKEVSKSAPLKTEIPAVLEKDTAYDLINQPVNWNGGYTSFFLGARKSSVDVETFHSRLAQHVWMVADAFKPLGLKGYIVIVGDDYEAAYMNWESELAAQRAFAMVKGELIRKDGESLMDFVQFSGLKKFDGVTLTPGEAYSTVN